ncbi:MAG TPA: hypothetical protein ENN72_00770 [Firmicutes bacterium]|nr:hypothetical protein [Bacillota bacterium]
MKTNNSFAETFLQRLGKLSGDRMRSSYDMKQRGEEWESVKKRIEEGVISACSEAFRKRYKMTYGEERPLRHDRVLKRIPGWEAMEPETFLEVSYSLYLDLLEEDWDREEALTGAHNDIEENEKVRIKKHALALVKDVFQKLKNEWNKEKDDQALSSNP